MVVIIYYYIGCKYKATTWYFVFFTLSDRAATVLYQVIYVVANPGRGLLDRKRSEEHLQSSNKSKIKARKQKRQKEGNNNKIDMPEKDKEGHSTL